MPRRTLLTLPALGAAAVGLTVLVRGGVGPEEVPPMPEGVREPQRHDYGSDPSQFGELTLPAGVPRGVAVVVHGGFWKTAYGIEYARPLVPSLVEQGWATWAIEYRRVGKGEGGGGGNPETFDDVRTAIEELDELVLGVDPSTVPVVGVGHSAGGHLATWAAGQGLLTHVVSQAGVLDLRGAYTAGLGGPGTVNQAIDAIRPGGHIHLIGVLTGRKGEVETAALMRKMGRLQGLTVGSRAMQLRMIAAIEATGMEPVISDRFALSDLAEAFRHEQDQKHFGKIAIDI